MTQTDYTANQTFAKGDRVELHPAHDLWMRGARYGTVTDTPNGSIVFVLVDKVNKRRWFHRESLRHALPTAVVLSPTKARRRILG